MGKKVSVQSCVSKCGGIVDTSTKYSVEGRVCHACNKCGRLHTLNGHGVLSKDGKLKYYWDRDGFYAKDRHGNLVP